MGYHTTSVITSMRCQPHPHGIEEVSEVGIPTHWWFDSIEDLIKVVGVVVVDISYEKVVLLGGEVVWESSDTERLLSSCSCVCL